MALKLQALEDGHHIEDIYDQTKIDPWFLYQINKLSVVLDQAKFNDSDGLKQLKRNGFSDFQIACKWEKSEDDIRKLRKNNGILPTYKVVDTCAAEFEALTPYCYSTYEKENEVIPLDGKKVMILGGGPKRMGQGMHLECCWCKEVLGLKEVVSKNLM